MVSNAESLEVIQVIEDTSAVMNEKASKIGITLTRIKEIIERIPTLESSNKQLALQNIALETKNKMMINRLITVDNVNKEMAQKIITLESSKEEIAQQKLSLETQNKEVTQTLKNLSAFNDQIVNQIEKLVTEVKMLTEIKTNLESSSEELIKQKDAIEAKNKEITRQISTLESKNRKKKKTIENLEAKIKAMSELSKAKKNQTMNFTKLNQYSSDDFGISSIVQYKHYESLHILKKVLLDELKRPKIFFEQIKNLTFLKHDNIYRYLDVWTELDLEIQPPTLVMYMLTDCKGKVTLENAINDGSFDHDLRRQMFGQLISAYEYLKKNSTIHGCLRIDNIFLVGESRLIIGDFGLSTKKKFLSDQVDYLRSLVELDLTEKDILDKDSNIGYKIDLFSLGIVYFNMCYPMKIPGFKETLYKMAYTCNNLKIQIQRLSTGDKKAIKTLLRCFKVQNKHIYTLNNLLFLCKNYLENGGSSDEENAQAKKIKLY